jgi:hypothetical protein
MFLYQALTLDIELVRQLRVDINEQTTMLNRGPVEM